MGTAERCRDPSVVTMVPNGPGVSPHGLLESQLAPGHPLKQAPLPTREGDCLPDVASRVQDGS